jgi:O-antigen/teichoic acid export membrane protein
MISFLLNPLYVHALPKTEFADVSIIFAWLVFFNVILSYGMETAFFRFYNLEDNKQKVISTSTISIFWTSFVFLVGALLFRETIANFINVKTEYVTYTIWILILDALVIIPFSRLRAEKKPMKYAVIKIGNVCINFGLNIFQPKIHCELFILKISKWAIFSFLIWWLVYSHLWYYLVIILK